MENAFGAFVQGRYSDAVVAFNELIDKEPSIAIHYVNRAAAHYSLELYRKVVKDCEQALEIDPQQERAFLLKGKALLKMGKDKLARKTWRQGVKVMKDVALFQEMASCLGGNLNEAEDTNVPTVQLTSNAISKNKLEDTEEKFEFPRTEATQNIDKKTFDALAAAAVGQIQHGVGDAKVDKVIALGYYKVNSGQLLDGIKIFNSLLQQNPKLVAAYLGRGTAYALGGKYDEAIADFTRSLDVDPNCVDALKRRGQTRAARGFENDALADFSLAIKLNPDHEAHHQRGLIYYRKKNFKRAVVDFEEAVKIDHSDALTWNHIGLCYDSLGDCKSAVEAHMKAIALKPDFKEAFVNLGQAYKDWGKIDKALENFDKGILVDKNYGHGYHLRGLAYFGVGRHYEALQDLIKAVSLNPNHVDTLIMLAVTKQGLGMLKEAVADFEKALKIEPQNACWYQKEIALWWHHRLDNPHREYNMDLDLDPQFKEYWCKRHAPSLLKVYKPQPGVNSSINDVAFDEKPANEQVHKLLQYGEWYGKLLHQDAPGYMSNKRQQRMASLATIHIAQKLRAFWFEGKDDVVGRISTQTKVDDDYKPGKFGWRDMYDIVIRWRQFSEPNDPVWWVDLLTPEQFAEGFGSHTPMITGQCFVVRYSPMIEMAFPIMKDEMIKQKNLSENLKARVREAKTCDDLYEVMRRDFWIVTPCYSTRTGKMMEGTRLTLQRTEPEGYEFSIRTPGTPPRWIDYDLEMKHVFNLLTQEVRRTPMDMEKVSNMILTVTYYWYNFMPLSRGTAACGYIALVAMFLAIGIKINALVPPKLLVDWQGILRPKPEEFIATISPWMFPARVSVDMNEFDSLPSSEETFQTLRQIIQALNCKIKDL